MELTAWLSSGQLVFVCSEHEEDRLFSSALGHLRYEHACEEQEARTKLAMAAYHAGQRDAREALGRVR